MKKTLTVILAIASLLAAGCKEKEYVRQTASGQLAFAGISTDAGVVEVDTKAEAASDSYCISITNAQGELACQTTWGEVKAASKKILLPVGGYTMTVMSAAELPLAGWENPVYTAQAEFQIKADEITQLEDLVCKIAQVKITVDYTEEFLASVTGNGNINVTLTGALDYAMTKEEGSEPVYEKRAGYFACDREIASTLVVTYVGSIDGKDSKMVKTFEGIKAGQWHKIVFAKKLTDEGNATVAITIDDFVEDEDLNHDVPGGEDSMGDDPDAPSGDGGIKLESTCSYDITQPIVIPANGEPFVFTLKAIVPNGVNKFIVDVQSTNSAIIDAIKLINDDKSTLDLVNPSAGAIEVFTTILPFPYGENVKGKDSIDFDLSEAQVPLNGFPGTHTFVMNVTDKKGCRKAISVIFEVPEPEQSEE